MLTEAEEEEAEAAMEEVADEEEIRVQENRKSMETSPRTITVITVTNRVTWLEIATATQTELEGEVQRVDQNRQVRPALAKPQKQLTM